MNEPTLQKLKNIGEIMDFRRDGINCDDIRAQIAAFSNSLILLSLIDDSICHDGYCIVLREDLTFVKFGTGVQSTWLRRIKMRDVKIENALPLESFEIVIKYLCENKIAWATYRENQSSDVCYVSDFAEWMPDDYIMLNNISSAGANDGFVVFNVREITRIEFCTKYLINLIATQDQ